MLGKGICVGAQEAADLAVAVASTHDGHDDHRERMIQTIASALAAAKVRNTLEMLDQCCCHDNDDRQTTYQNLTALPPRGGQGGVKPSRTSAHRTRAGVRARRLPHRAGRAA